MAINHIIISRIWSKVLYNDVRSKMKQSRFLKSNAISIYILWLVETRADRTDIQNDLKLEKVVEIEIIFKIVAWQLIATNIY